MKINGYKVEDGDLIPRFLHNGVGVVTEIASTAMLALPFKGDVSPSYNSDSEVIRVANASKGADLVITYTPTFFDLTNDQKTRSVHIAYGEEWQFTYLRTGGVYAIRTAVNKGDVSGVTSVGLEAPADLSVSGSPVTGSGTIKLTRNKQATNTFLAGPENGADAEPSYRKLTSADLPAPAPVAANSIYAGPTTGANAAPTYRKLVAADLPAPSAVAANLVYAGPATGADAAPTYRKLTTTDLPTPKLTGYKVADLPAGSEGEMAYVTDGIDTAAWGDAVAGGGTKKRPVFHDGTGWVFM